MPVVNNNLIQNLTASQALKRGYFTLSEYNTHVDWVNQDFDNRHNTTIVYINRVYVGVATKNTPLYKIAEKFIK